MQNSSLIVLNLVYKMNTQEINELIFPFQIHYNEEHKRNYYFNLETGSSLW